MIRLTILRLFCCFLLLQGAAAYSQGQPAFWNEIQSFRKGDSVQSPPRNSILFVGSSSFRLWNNLAQAFPQHTVINRGFGGSSLIHVVQYAADIIFPYQPKQVIIYCGENDLTDSTVNGEMVYQRFRGLYSLIREKLPNTHIAYVSMKPSPSRWHLKDKIEYGNNRIKEFLSKEKNAAYIDIWQAMLKDGKPNDELFVQDKLHMNEKGYQIWQKQITPYLLKTD